MKDMTKNLLEMVSDLFGEPDGAYNIREDSACGRTEILPQCGDCLQNR